MTHPGSPGSGAGCPGRKGTAGALAGAGRLLILFGLLVVLVSAAGCGLKISPNYGHVRGKVTVDWGGSGGIAGAAGAAGAESDANTSSGLAKKSLPPGLIKQARDIRRPGGAAKFMWETDTEEETQELIVGFKTGGVSTASVERLAFQEGASVVSSNPAKGAHLVRVRDAGKVAEVRKRLAARKDVAYVEPNRKVYLARRPNDTLFQQGYQWNLERINLPAAWDVTTGSQTVTVAILDTGVRFGHQDLPQRWQWASGADFVGERSWGNPADTDPTDPGSNQYRDSHGTFVAGIVGALTNNYNALTNNYEGIAAVAWSVRLMPIRVIGPDDSGSEWDIADGIDWAVSHGADIINMSFVGNPGTEAGPYLSGAIESAASSGVLLVAAAGNTGDASDPRPGMPATHSKVISVGAISNASGWYPRAYYSSYGSKLDIVAPGGDVSGSSSGGVISTTWTQADNWFGYESVAGTSFAAPHIAGVAALLMARGIRDPAKIKQILYNTATDLGSFGKDSQYGYGLVDAAKALGASVPVVFMAKKTVLGNGQVNLELVSEERSPDSNGYYDLWSVSPGTWTLVGLIDTDGNDKIEEGEYYGEYPGLVSIAAGETLYNMNFTISQWVSSASAGSARSSSIRLTRGRRR